MGRSIYRNFDWARLAGLALAYALLARLVLTLSTANGNVTIFWLPGGLALATVLAWGMRLWPAVFAGAAAAGLMVGDPPLTSLLIALGNTLETLAAAWLLQTRLRFNPELGRPHDFMLLALAGTLASSISAVVGPFSLWLSGYLSVETLARNVGHWWQADVLGIILGTPLFLVWRQFPQEWRTGKRAAEALLFFFMAFAAGQAIFLGWFRELLGLYAEGFWIFLLATLAALRFGQHGVLLLISMAAVQALWGAAHETGYFGQDIAQTGLQRFWLYQLTLTVSGLALSLILQAKERAASILRESEERYRLLVEQSADGILVHDAQHRYVEANPAACQILGYSREEILGLAIADMIAEDEAVRVAPDEQRFSEGRVVFSEYRCRRKDGSIFVGEVTGSPLPNGQFLGILRDITERKRTEESLRLAKLVYENASEAMFATELDGTIMDVNPAFTRITGYTAEEAVGNTPRMLSSGLQDSGFYRKLWVALNTTGHWQGEIWNRRKNGDLFAEHLSINAILRDDGTPWRYVALFSDITEKKASEELLWKQANLDPLTGLPNRRMFQDRLAQAIKKSERSGLPLALLLLDLDRFKEVNDSLGHEVGDELLKETARRLTHCVRESDTVARLGGDEFTIILGGLESAEGLDRVAHALLASLIQPFRLGTETAYISVSIGITLYPDDAPDLETLVKNADQAMYAAKRQGRNRFCYFTPSMQEAAERRLRLANDLRDAIAHNQFEIHYQPIVELATGGVHKAEALLRWKHPGKGIINPAHFIPVAEDTGLIHEIGEWVFKHAVAQVKHFRQSGHPHFQISVNKSPIQFQAPASASASAFKDWDEYLRGEDLPGDGLVVEITETLLMDAHENIRSKLLRFREYGIEVAIDDFGTGYSALSYLKKFDIDYLKIDQCFTRNLHPQSSDLALCEAIVVMAHKLGLKVIAEGVETRQQRDLLAQIGCDYGQGYWFAQPMAAAELEQWLPRFQEHKQNDLRKRFG